MIYLSDDIDHFPSDIIRDTFPLMPLERQQRAMRYRQEHDRKTCILAYWILLKGLQQEYGIATPVSFRYGLNGKPYLENFRGIFFNISHCKKGVVCAISENEVGVDIQDVRPFNLNVAKRVCTEQELKYLAQYEDPSQYFCEIWTVKESYIKLQNGSIAQPLNTIDSYLLMQKGNRAIAHWGNGCHVYCIGESKIINVNI
jgi:4'-phosphopantetheinyl transferase